VEDEHINPFPKLLSKIEISATCGQNLTPAGVVEKISRALHV
jgi:hypothetical protein